MASYLMERDFDCGPAMVYSLLQDQGIQISYQDLLRKWRFPSIALFADLRDSPGAHWRIFKSFGIPWKKVTLNDIWDGKTDLKKTAVLVHSLDHPIISQHWIVLDRFENNMLFFQWGDGAIKGWTKESFTRYFCEGFPNCAYEIGVGSTDWCWEMVYDLFVQWSPVFLILLVLLIFFLSGAHI